MPAASGRTAFATLLAQQGVLRKTLRNAPGNQRLTLLVDARHHIVEVRFGLDAEIPAAERGELNGPGLAGCGDGKIQKFFVHDPYRLSAKYL